MDEFFSKKNISIYFFGEPLIEVCTNPDKVGFGGDVLNTAIYISRSFRDSGFIANIYLLSAVGKDIWSENLLQKCQKENVNTALASKVRDINLGLYAVTVNECGERSFSYWRKETPIKYYFQDNDLCINNIIENDLDGYIYLSGISLVVLSKKDRYKLLKSLHGFKENGGRIIFDDNYREKLWDRREAGFWHLKILGIVDIVFLTDTDEEKLFSLSNKNEIIDFYKRFDIDEIIIRRGAESCIVSSRGKIISTPACPVDKIIDTSGAGDSFAAGYLSKRLQGCAISESAKYAHNLAAKVISYPGAIIEKKCFPI